VKQRRGRDKWEGIFGERERGRGESSLDWELITERTGRAEGIYILVLEAFERRISFASGVG
jgi:hypothetical protein